MIHGTAQPVFLCGLCVLYGKSSGPISLEPDSRKQRGAFTEFGREQGVASRPKRTPEFSLKAKRHTDAVAPLTRPNDPPILW